MQEVSFKDWIILVKNSWQSWEVAPNVLNVAAEWIVDETSYWAETNFILFRDFYVVTIFFGGLVIEKFVGKLKSGKSTCSFPVLPFSSSFLAGFPGLGTVVLCFHFGRTNQPFSFLCVHSFLLTMTWDFSHWRVAQQVFYTKGHTFSIQFTLIKFVFHFHIHNKYLSNFHSLQNSYGVIHFGYI